MSNNARRLNRRNRARIRRQLSAVSQVQSVTTQDLGDIRRYARELRDMIAKQERQLDAARSLLTAITRATNGERRR